MSHYPPHRWFRFRLSTLLVLVGIAAWAMSCRPYYPVVGRSNWEAILVTPTPKGANPYALPFKGLRQVTKRELNAGLKWPTLALAAFVMWKAFAFALRDTAPQKTANS